MSRGRPVPVLSQGGPLRAMLSLLRREFWVVAVFSMVANVLMLAPTLYMLQVYDRVLVSQSETTLLVVSLITLFLFMVMAFAEWSRSRVLVRAGMHLDAVLGPQVWVASFEQAARRSEGASGRGLADLTQLRQFLTGNGVIAFFDTPWTPIYIGVLFLLHPWLGVLALCLALAQGALAWWGNRAAREPSAELSRLENDAQVFLQSKLRGAESVQAMGMVPALRGQWLQRHGAAMVQHARTLGQSHRLQAMSKFLRYAAQGASLGVGALLVIDGQISPGAMIAANVLTTRALAPIDLLVGTWRGFLSAREAFGRLQALLEEAPQQRGSGGVASAAPQGVLRLRGLNAAPGTGPGPVPQGQLVLDDVQTRVPGREAPVLNGVSLRTAPGQLTVVLGPSGSGKSTLARVLVGLCMPSAGQVSLDGRPLAAWDAQALGPHVGYLPQEVELFDATVAENIGRLGEVDSQRVIAAARAAGLHEMILRLPKGYDTPLGESGRFLSGGQRQRIALARALYGEPALLVLDEPNANLDDAGEAALQQAVLRMREQGKNVVAVTHRGGLAALADQLVVLEAGRVRLAGAPQEVLKALKPAAALPAGQTGGVGPSGTMPQPA